jgi:Sperm-tail PG-rich repeat
MRAMQGPGAYAPETKIEALSTVKSQQSFGFAGPLAGVDRRKTGPFGRAFAAGSAPGPGQYLSQDHETPRPQSSAPTSFGLADRSTFARVWTTPCVFSRACVLGGHTSRLVLLFRSEAVRSVCEAPAGPDGHTRPGPVQNGRRRKNPGA